MAVFQFKREWYSKHFAPVLMSCERYMILMGGRGCFDASQKIQTIDGLKNIADVKVGDVVMSFNESSLQYEYKPVTKAFEYDCDEEIVIASVNGKQVKCTKDHKFFVNGEWKPIIQIINENSDTPELSEIHDKCGRHDIHTCEVWGPKGRFNTTRIRCKRVSKDNAKTQGRKDKNRKSSQDSCRSVFRDFRTYRKSQRRHKVQQCNREFGVLYPQRELLACKRKWVAKFVARQPNRKFNIERASSIRNKRKIHSACLHQTNVSRRIWGKPIDNKGYNTKAELGSFVINNYRFEHFKGKVYDICVQDNHNYILECGMIAHNSGKTRHIMLKLFAATFSNKHVSVIYCRHEFETIRKTTFQDMVNFLKSVPELNECFDYSTSLNGSMVFTNKLTGNKLSPFGLDDPDKTKGISEATHVWIDEIDKCTKEQYAMVNSVLRTPQAEYLQFIGSFNPVSESSWLRTTFFDESDAYSPNKAYGDELLVHHSTVYNNEYVDVEAYERSLTLMYAGNKNLLDVNLRGYWGVEQVDNPWLHAFDVEKHVRRDVEFYPTFPIYVFIDVNNEPLECSLWQLSPNYGTKHSFIHCIDEFSGKYKINELGAAIKAKYPHSIIYLGGDRSGQNQDVGRNQTVYQILAGTMGLTDRQLLLNSHNLTHADSYMLCNSMLFNYPNIYFSEQNCPNLILQCQTAEIDMKSTTPFKLKKDRERHKNDALDSFRYMMQTLFNDFAKNTYFKVINK